MTTLKTPITVLQEMMMKHGESPEYECIAQTGPQHLATFEYKCVAYGEAVYATARSKKEAKQEVARIMLAALARRGIYAQEAGAPLIPTPMAPPPPAARSHVALLRELCEEYRLPAPDYVPIDETGPPHLRRFTVRANVGEHTRTATATTKKSARQLAAEQLYVYLRENLRITRDFVEEDALVRAHEKVMERYLETREDQPWRIDFGQKISEYHLCLINQCSNEVRALGLEALTGPHPAEVLVESCASALGLTTNWCELPPLKLLSLSPCSPSVTIAGYSRDEVASSAVSYLRLMLTQVPDT